MGVTLFACSFGHRGYECQIRRGRMPFNAGTSADADIVNSLPPTTDWLYYPEQVAAWLKSHGIASRIHCHSGDVLVTE